MKAAISSSNGIKQAAKNNLASFDYKRENTSSQLATAISLILQLHCSVCTALGLFSFRGGLARLAGLFEQVA